MDLIIPTRHQPTTGSFPTDAAQVEQWLSQLTPATSMSATRSIVRGIKHFNRLENTIASRFDVLALFRPAIDEIIQFSDAQYSSQNLPLDTKERNALHLSSTLRQELLFGYLTIVFLSTERPAPGTLKIYNRSILYAMELLLTIATRLAQMHESIPSLVWQNINQLFLICENQCLSQQRVISTKDVHEALKTPEDFFLCVHLNDLIPYYALTPGQTHQLQQFIVKAIPKVVLAQELDSDHSVKHKFAVDLHSNAPLTALSFSKTSTPEAMRVLDLSGLVTHIYDVLKRTPDIVSTLYETDVLTKNTLLQFLHRIEDDQSRHQARRFCHYSLHLTTGLKEAYASQKYEFDDAIQTLTPKTVKGKQTSAYTGNWIQLNRSETGACLQWKIDKPSQISVGELAQSQEYFGKNAFWVTSIVIWMKVDESQKLYCGLHHLAKETEAVQVVSQKKGSTEGDVYSEGLIATRLDSAIECLFVPSFTYYSNEVVSISRDDSSCDYKLLNKLESTTAFSCFSLEKI